MKSNSVDQYILKQEGDIRVMMEILNDFLCLEVALESGLRYGLPFFMEKKKMICYLHKCKDGTVDVTFWKGHLLVKDYPHLEQRDRKIMASLNYSTPVEMNLELIHEIANAVRANR